MKMNLQTVFRFVGSCHVLFVLAVLLAAVGCDNAPPVSAAASSNPSAKPEMPAASHAGKEDDYVASGPIVVENQVDVLALRGGVIAHISADVGANVRKGDLLALLDDREPLAQRDAAEAKLKTCEADLNDWEAEAHVAETDYDRAQRMREAGINTQQDLEHAKYKLEGSKFEIEKAQREIDNARNNLRFYELELQKTRIEAPFDGVVARRYVRVGQTAAAGDRMFWVSAVAPLLVKFTLPERYIGQIKTGCVVYLSSPSLPDRKFLAKVIQMSPLVDPASDSIDVVAKLEGKPDGLRPGMAANIRLTDPAAESR